MIRYAYINNQVFNLYAKLPELIFPLNPRKVIDLLPNCRFMTYRHLAEISHSSIRDVVELCESESGCTHYDTAHQRYLILLNQDDGQSNTGRQRWTCSHEIGHIVCNHHLISAQSKLAEHGLLQVVNPEYEAEADYFAATFLAPFPLFQLLNINSPIDVQNKLGLSCEASIYRYKQYLRWKQTRVKTAWENDMARMYRQKNLL